MPSPGGSADGQILQLGKLTRPDRPHGELKETSEVRAGVWAEVRSLGLVRAAVVFKATLLYRARARMGTDDRDVETSSGAQRTPRE